MLQPGELGVGWLLDSQYQDAPNPYSSGGLHAVFRRGSRPSDPSLAGFVEVYNSIESADAAWKRIASYGLGGQPFNRCDADFAKANSDDSVLLECRIKNVSLIVNFAPSDLAQRMLQVMIDRVRALAS